MIGTVGIRTNLFIYYIFFHIYKYLRPDELSLLPFIKFHQISNGYHTLCGNGKNI